jgi:hypothetical protein
MGIQRSKYKRDSATSKYKLGQPSSNGGSSSVVVVMTMIIDHLLQT